MRWEPTVESGITWQCDNVILDVWPGCLADHEAKSSEDRSKARYFCSAVP